MSANRIGEVVITDPRGTLSAWSMSTPRREKKVAYLAFAGWSATYGIEGRQST